MRHIDLKPTVSIIQLGSPPSDLQNVHGGQSDWVKRALASVDITLDIVRPHEGDALPAPTAIDGAILTGSWSMVTDLEPWSVSTATWVREAMDVQLPLFGICYGHQLMAQALGGTVGFHPQGREIGQHLIRLREEAFNDPLIPGTPGAFLANLTHEQTVLKPPATAVCLGESDHDAYQILRYSQSAVSVQFHPEFDPAILAACLLRRQSVFTGEGYDIADMVSRLQPTPLAKQILIKFVSGLVQ